MRQRKAATFLLALLLLLWTPVASRTVLGDGEEEESPVQTPFLGPGGEVRTIFRPEFRDAPGLLEDLRSFQVADLAVELVGPLLPPERPGGPAVPSRLLLTGRPATLSRAREVLRYLDVPQPSVVVSLLAAEVQARHEGETGGYLSFDRTGPDGGPPTVFRALYSEFEPDSYLRSRLVPDRPFEGTTLRFANFGQDILEDGAFELVLRYLAHDQSAEFLAWPTVVCTEGRPGTITSVVRTTQLVLRSSQGTSAAVQSVPAETGITMEVLPQKIGTDAADLSLVADLLFALPESEDAAAAGEIVLHRRRVQTRFTIRDQESLLIGGLRIRRRLGAERGLPVLIGIPGLTMTSKDCLETELVLLVKARVVVPDRSSGLVLPPGEARRLEAARQR